MPVVAAGMALPGVFEAQAYPLVSELAEHPCRSGNRWSAISVPTLDDADDAGFADASFTHVTAEGFQFFSHEFSSLETSIEKFRVLMQMASPAGNVFLHFSHTVQYRHFLFSLFFVPRRLSDDILRLEFPLLQA